MGFRAARLMWVVMPLLAVAVYSASEWPARAQMLEGPARDAWFPLAQGWEKIARPGTPSSAEDVGAPLVATATAAPAATALVSAAPVPVKPTLVALAAPVASSPPPVAPIPQAPSVPKEGTVLMLGDSLMGGVVSGLRSDLPKTYRIVDRHKSSTGLTNQQYFDWPSVARQATAEVKPAWVVIHLGGNDGQDMLVDGKWVKFGTAQWDTLYTQRAATMIQGVHAAWPQARIVWLGLPTMRPPSYQAKSARINGLQKAAALQQGIAFVDAHAALGEAYSKDGVGASGKREIWRLDDGIHYSRAGGGQLGRAVAASAGWVF